MVDDCFDNLSPNDAQHDEFGRKWSLSTWPIPTSLSRTFRFNDRGNLQPNVPLLSDRYKTLIWENHGSGYNADTALIRSTALSYRLSTYLRAGGKLWLGGRMTVGATTPAPNLVSADLSYPKTDLGPGDWAWDFLKLPKRQRHHKRAPDLLPRSTTAWWTSRSFRSSHATPSAETFAPGSAGREVRSLTAVTNRAGSVSPTRLRRICARRGNETMFQACSAFTSFPFRS